MRSTQARIAARLLGAALTLSFLLLLAVPAAAAGYPRRIAVASFVSLANEDIGATVAVLPRLLASRLMALAGADVLLLPAGGKSPAEAALEAKYPLLLQGTVSKLGKGYSIDATVTDLVEGKSAGAFFASAATEDDIIAQLGILSGEIAEKVFGVQGAVRAVSPAPVVAAPIVAPPAIGGSSAVPSAPAQAQGPAPAHAPATLAGGWVPSSMKKIGQSDRIVDALQGIASLDADAEGNGMVAAYGRNTIYIYRVKGDELLPYTRISRPLNHHLLHVDAIDLDGDGLKEIIVTDLIDESIQSFILKKKGDVYEEAGENIRYYLVALSDWKGKPALVGQYQGITTPFQENILNLRWDGKQISPGEPFPFDKKVSLLSTGVLGLSSARFGNEWRWIYTDEESFLRVLDSEGKSIFKSRTRYGMGQDFFEWGPYIEIEGRRKQIPLRKPARVAKGGGENPIVLTVEVKRGFLDVTGGAYDSTRIVLLQWEVGDFIERTGTPGTSLFLSGVDFLSNSDFSKGGRIVASVIEQSGLLKDSVSRLLLYQVQ